MSDDPNGSNGSSSSRAPLYLIALVLSLMLFFLVFPGCAADVRGFAGGFFDAMFRDLGLKPQPTRTP